jgi:O-antigen/teichoic acid export membrane protein
MRAIAQVFFSDVLSKVIVGLTTIILIRQMTHTEFASYTVAFALVGLVSQMIAGSFNRMYILRDEIIDRAVTVETYVAAQLWTCLGMVLITLPFGLLWTGLYVPSLILLVGFLLSEFAKTYYQEKRNFFRLSMVELARSGLFLASLCAIDLLFQEQLTAECTALLQGMIMIIITLTVFTGRIRITKLIDYRNALRLLRMILTGEHKYITGYFVLVAVLSNLTVLLLRMQEDDYQLALFASAFRYFSMMSLCLSAVHVVLLPAIRHTLEKNEIQRLFIRHRKMLPWFIVWVFLAAIGSRWIIPLINGGKYPESVGVFQVLAASLVFSFAFSPYINLLLIIRHYKLIFWLMVVGVSVTAIISAALIAYAGAIGAACGFSIAMAGINYVVYKQARHYVWKAYDCFNDTQEHAALQGPIVNRQSVCLAKASQRDDR